MVGRIVTGWIFFLTCAPDLHLVYELYVGVGEEK